MALHDGEGLEDVVRVLGFDAMLPTLGIKKRCLRAVVLSFNPGLPIRWDPWIESTYRLGPVDSAHQGTVIPECLLRP